MTAVGCEREWKQDCVTFWLCIGCSKGDDENVRDVIETERNLGELLNRLIPLSSVIRPCGLVVFNCFSLSAVQTWLLTAVVIYLR
jgi:hypothetical protein